MSKCSTCLKMSRYGYCDNMSSMDIGDRNPCVDGSMYEPRRFTNADRIRGMSDEELHKFLLDFEAGDIDYAKTFCDLCCKDAALERKSIDCEGCLLWWLKNGATLPQGIDWLRQPVKEELT